MADEPQSLEEFVLGELTAVLKKAKLAQQGDSARQFPKSADQVRWDAFGEAMVGLTKVITRLARVVEELARG
jgi:hypothetical protein